MISILLVETLLRSPAAFKSVRFKPFRLIAMATVVFGLSASVGTAQADEVTLSAGALHADSDDDTSTYSYQLEYRRPVYGPFSASFTWLNEGHITNHHRDGQSVQGWWQSKPETALGLLFDLGIGPYRYYDTTRGAPDAAYQNAHGWAWLATAEADYRFDSRWLLSMRVNQVEGNRSFDTTSFLVGVGYVFDDPLTGLPPDQPLLPARMSWEADAYLGDTILNSFNSQGHTTGGLGGRLQLTDWLSGSVTYLDASENDNGWRSAVLAQVWAEHPLTRQITVGVSLGGFFPFDNHYDHAQSSESASALIGIEAGYTISKQWVGRFIWNRIGTGDNHDSDLYLFNLGYRF